jgi:hypothetical protein
MNNLLFSVNAAGEERSNHDITYLEKIVGKSSNIIGHGSHTREEHIQEE